MTQALAAYGRLPQDAVEAVPNWICIREVAIPAADGKLAFYGDTVAMAQDMATAKALAAAPKLIAAARLALENLDARSMTRAKWTQRDQNAYEALQAALAAV